MGPDAKLGERPRSGLSAIALLSRGLDRVREIAGEDEFLPRSSTCAMRVPTVGLEIGIGEAYHAGDGAVGESSISAKSCSNVGCGSIHSQEYVSEYWRGGYNAVGDKEWSLCKTGEAEEVSMGVCE